MTTIRIDKTGAAAEYNDIVPSISITNLLSQRNAVLERLAQAVTLIQEAHEIASAANLGLPLFTVDNRRCDGVDLVNPSNPTEALTRATAVIDSGAWKHLVSESGLRSLMSAARRKELDEQIHNHKTPPLTREAIAATFASMHANRGAMFDEGVIAVYKRLSWDYRTNLPHKFGCKLIMRCVGAAYGLGLDCRQCDQLDDLVRVFSVLDSLPEPDHRTGVYITLSQQAHEQHQYPQHLAHRYFTMKLYKNRNAHIRFTRPDLVDGLNNILARHYPGALPPARDEA